jgi:MFS family permease
MNPRADVTETKTAAEPAGLWRQPDFLKFWLALNVSFLGTSVSSLAYPLVAVLVLEASPVQMGWLRAAGSAASFVVGPVAGVLADRVRRRPLLIFSDLGSALLAASIPAAYALGALRISQLYVVQFLAGALSIIAEVTLMAYLPSLVRRDQIVAANSQMEATSSTISIAGPSLAGFLVQVLSAPVVIIFDSVSFLLSALCTVLIRAPEPEPAPAHERRGVPAEAWEGLRAVYDHELLRPLAQSIAVHFFFATMVYSLFVLYAVREVGLAPAPLGLVMASLGPGFLLGALAAPRAARRFGVGRVMVWATLLTAAGMSLIPLASGTTATVAFVFAAGHFVMACGIQLHGVNMMSLRQTVMPHRLQGRVNASFRYVNLLAGGVGALIGGAIAERVGLRPTLAVGAAGLLLPFLRLLLSPVRHLREIPAEEGMMNAE